MKLWLFMDVQQSVVKQTDTAFSFICYFISFKHFSYAKGNAVLEKVCLLGRLYAGFNILIKSLKPLSSTILNGL